MQKLKQACKNHIILDTQHPQQQQEKTTEKHKAFINLFKYIFKRKNEKKQKKNNNPAK